MVIVFLSFVLSLSFLLVIIFFFVLHGVTILFRFFGFLLFISFSLFLFTSVTILFAFVVLIFVVLRCRLHRHFDCPRFVVAVDFLVAVVLVVLFLLPGDVYSTSISRSSYNTKPNWGPHRNGWTLEAKQLNGEFTKIFSSLKLCCHHHQSPAEAVRARMTRGFRNCSCEWREQWVGQLWFTLSLSSRKSSLVTSSSSRP